ncbi:fatty acyl-AMP ligase [Vibrio quintilis]|uniref:Putative fatty-acid--CoA ligase fadD21 n=1 Tax=Vibrio quintilis TaxID=1117707 RepID=A0A1M7YVF8_9VIBR|nr:fatty acyl-AMP ligase [Vibrio quintilis]SHO56624.1 Putative fatty-acid--CoA ligase fadD21 [Vibrio quintilis]
MFIDHASTILDCLTGYRNTHPNALAYTFLPGGKPQGKVVTDYRTLDEQARKIAYSLVKRGLAGKNAILLYPAGLEFMYALYGCFYAGVVAIPGNLSRNSHHLMRLRDIIRDAGASAVLTTAELKDSMMSKLDCPEVEWLSFESEDMCISADLFPEVKREDIAFIQYTSGSTASPKGVMVSHGNLLANIIAIRDTFGTGEHVRIGGWLPQFHDMGLIGHILHASALGGHYVFMPPLSFIQRPVRWLQLMSDYHCAFSTVPNFAYDLCVDKVSPEKLQGLDFSHWKWAGNGAEPVQAETIDAFTRFLAPYGFSPAAMTPCYGMAETTLMVSSSTDEEVPVICEIPDSDVYQLDEYSQSQESRQKMQRLVSCGRVAPGHRIVIVHPETKQIQAEGQIGEIWVSGDSVAQGYWNNPDKTRQDFHAYTACGQGPFLRTGDSGITQDDQLFISGRLKDLIIVRGRNIFPQDIERSLADISPLFRKNKTAAIQTGQEIVLIQEVEKAALKSPALAESIYQSVTALTQAYEVSIRDLVLIPANTLPMTSSGKVQRALCRKRYEQSNFNVLCSLISIKDFEDERKKSNSVA